MQSSSILIIHPSCFRTDNIDMKTT